MEVPGGLGPSAPPLPPPPPPPPPPSLTHLSGLHKGGPVEVLPQLWGQRQPSRGPRLSPLRSQPAVGAVMTARHPAAAAACTIHTTDHASPHPPAPPRLLSPYSFTFLPAELPLPFPPTPAVCYSRPPPSHLLRKGEAERRRWAPHFFECAGAASSSGGRLDGLQLTTYRRREVLDAATFSG